MKGKRVRKGKKIGRKGREAGNEMKGTKERRWGKGNEMKGKERMRKERKVISVPLSPLFLLQHVSHFYLIFILFF